MGAVIPPGVDGRVCAVGPQLDNGAVWNCCCSTLAQTCHLVAAAGLYNDVVCTRFVVAMGKYPTSLLDIKPVLVPVLFLQR